MKIAAIREEIRKIGFYMPFRVHFLLVIIALVLAEHWLQKNNALPETSRTAIINVFVAVTFWFTLAILVVSFLTAFIPWLFFLFNKKNNKALLQIKTPERNITNKQSLLVNISAIVKPLFGYIRLRLLYDGKNISPKFAPINRGPKNDFLSGNIKGVYAWPLQNIKEYEVNKGIIYFEDFFQFFSFIVQLPANSNFFTHPLYSATGALNVQPKKTEETNMRIEEMRKVEGEFLNYKNFENNDDVRRIVWKIYAKNKELVVRIPETSDPYASHIYLYASFYNVLTDDVYEEFNSFFLDNFKTIVWNVYDQLYRQKALVQYIPDQETKTFYADDAIQRVKYIVSTSSWQKQNDLLTYFNKQYGSILCISSLTDAKQLEEIIEKAGVGLTVIFVPSSKSFTHVKVTEWLQWIFIKPKKKSSEKLQIAFNLSPLRRKILENEKLIKALLNKSECEVLVMETNSDS
ncbi:MAG: DUF58 domain-containing protein [Bacteroidota bacterium]|nr:DUF58 domain-containing protein [Bacteroidota bacterium]